MDKITYGLHFINETQNGCKYLTFSALPGNQFTVTPQKNQCCQTGIHPVRHHVDRITYGLHFINRTQNGCQYLTVTALPGNQFTVTPQKNQCCQTGIYPVRHHVDRITYGLHFINQTQNCCQYLTVSALPDNQFTVTPQKNQCCQTGIYPVWHHNPPYPLPKVTHSSFYTVYISYLRITF